MIQRMLSLISGSSAFSKSSFNLWKFTVHILLKPGLNNFEHYFTSMWDECNCVVVWASLPWSDGTRYHDLRVWMMSFKPAFSLSSFTFIKRVFSSFLFSAIKYHLCICVLAAQSCLTLCNPMECSPRVRLLCPWNFPGKNIGAGCRFLLQGIFPTQGLNLGFLNYRQILYLLSH